MNTNFTWSGIFTSILKFIQAFSQKVKVRLNSMSQLSKKIMKQEMAISLAGRKSRIKQYTRAVLADVTVTATGSTKLANIPCHYAHLAEYLTSFCCHQTLQSFYLHPSHHTAVVSMLFLDHPLIVLVRMDAPHLLRSQTNK